MQTDQNKLWNVHCLNLKVPSNYFSDDFKTLFISWLDRMQSKGQNKFMRLRILSGIKALLIQDMKLRSFYATVFSSIKMDILLW